MPAHKSSLFDRLQGLFRKELSFGTWNTYNKGLESLKDAKAGWVLDIFADFAKGNTLTFLQEVRSESWLEKLADTAGASFRYIIQPAGDKREYYGLVFPGKVKVENLYKYIDRGDLFTRTPQAVYMEYQGYSALGIHVHLDPVREKAQKEFLSLEKVIVPASRYYDTENIFLIGDFNFRLTPGILRKLNLGSMHLIPSPGEDTTFFGKEKDTIDGIYLLKAYNTLHQSKSGVVQPHFGYPYNWKIPLVEKIDPLAGDGYLNKLTLKLSDHRPVRAVILV